MILVDTSVWVDHLRRGNRELQGLLYESKVLCHPFVTGELACGSLKNRREILTLLRSLPQAQVAENEEVLRLVEDARLYGRGIGWVDAHLLAATLLSRTPIWTLDRQLASAAKALRVSI
jgi:predicted nucleic acid-binding protein